MEAVQKQRLRDLVEEGLAEMAKIHDEVAHDWRIADSEHWPNP
jgi:hypothetical protein